LHGGKYLVDTFPVQRETLKYILADAMARPLPEVVPRALTLPLDSRKVVALVGIRRCGKTSILYDTMRRLEASGVDRRRMVYLNFEDDRLLPIETAEFDHVLRAHAELYPEVAGQPRYYFFDEVQRAPRWETFVRRLVDTEGARVFVTGSSSDLLVRDVATSLRGRSISFEVFPLSFPEFLAFRGIEHTRYSRASEGRIAAALDDYLDTGGLPEIVLADEALRPRILQEYVDLVFYKDLVDRYRVGNGPVMRQLLKTCLGQPAALFSAHKVYQDLRSQGYQLSKDTVYQYLGYLEESYVVFTLAVAEKSIRKQAANPKKVHPVDWALGYPFVPARRIDVGHKLETAVFLHWRRQRRDLAYLAGAREVDLVVDPDRPEAALNVAYSVTDADTWDREMASLEAAATRVPKAERVLVAHETGSRKPPKGVKVLDAWRYLLGA